jgi:xanthine dehydrogenase YagT iron-sulfur-binding subunit
MKPMESGPGTPSRYTRRSFIRNIGATAVASAAVQAEVIAADLQQANAETMIGPAAVPITLSVNGKSYALNLEPRVTLLDALRQHTDLTGAKEVCDRGTCGACTVLFDGRPIYACMKLALEAQGHEITTVEGLGREATLSRIQSAFVEKDAMMCGYCTPGFIMSLTALLQRNPRPAADEVRHACAGNLCRCGTQPRIIEAALWSAGIANAQKTEVIHYADLA